MFDRDLVTSGFDTETLVSEEYVTYLLLAQIEAGLLPVELDIVDPAAGLDLKVILHPPLPPDYQRRYEPEPSAPLPAPANPSFTVELLPEGAEAFMRLTISVSVVDNVTNQTSGPLPAAMLVDFALESETTDAGLERNHGLRLSFLRFDDDTRAVLQAFGIDPVPVESEARERLDRTVPLGVAQGQQVQQIRMRKFVDGGHRSLGLYVNLALRSDVAPGVFHPPRGDIAEAQDFRTPGFPIAFSTAPGLFALLGPDAKFRQAEETEPGSGEFRFPLRKDPLDRESDEIGRIKGITIGPEVLVLPNQPPTTTGRLEIDIHGEYTDAPGDPDFHLELFFEPKIEDGIVEWDLDVDVDLGLLASLLLLAAGIGLTLLFAPGLAWGSSLLVGLVVGLAVLKGLIAEPLAAKLIGDRLDDEAQASFLDALPLRVPAARRRWDPLYLTEHQVVALVDDVVIDTRGIAFEGTALVLDKQPRPIDHVVIRDETRAGNGAVTGLRYRVADFQNLTVDLQANGPGRDRMEFGRDDPTAEPTLVTLTHAQISERIEADRILAPITYTAERIFVVEHEIDAILCLSRRERAEQRDRLIRVFRTQTGNEIRATEGAAIRQQVIADLTAALGRVPTEEEIVAEVNKRIEARINERQPAFEEDELPELLDTAVAQQLRFDLAPEELIERQLAGVLLLDGKEIITRHNADSTATPYYRDRPDGDPRDNLLALPHYSLPYQPPV